MPSTVDYIVWSASAFLAAGVGLSRYSRWKTRFDLVRQLVAMTPEQRDKMLNRMDPARAMEVRQALMERYRIAC